jgi:hypothetical protein
VLPSEYIAEERPNRIGLRRVEQRVRTDDRHGRIFASPLLRHPDKASVGDGSRVDELHAFVECRAATEVIEEALAPAEQGGHDRQVQLVDEARPELLQDGGGPASQPDVVAVGGLERSLERRLDAVVDEVERCSSPHRDRRAG